jgi:ATP-dependent exoDNAse (exonuclease V) alpha subunit
MECKDLTPEQRDDELNAIHHLKFLPDFKVEDRDGRVRGEHRFRPADMQRVAGHRDRILGRCGELVPIVQFYNGVLKKIVRRKVQNSDYPCFVVSQIPLIHAWALSIHKCQGDDGHSGD